MQQKFSMRKLKSNNRVEYLYRSKYRLECKNEGLSGAALRAEGIRRAKRQYKEENLRVQQQATVKPKEKPGENKQLLAILPRKPKQ